MEPTAPGCYADSMPRSEQDKAARARKYGRRTRVLKAAKSAQDLAAVTKELLAQLKRAGVPKPRVAELKEGLAYTDTKRHRAAVWAIVAALEDAERSVPTRQ